MLQACTGCESKPVGDRANQTINLFPEKKETVGNTGNLTMEEAFKQSKLVLHVSHLQKIDSSNTRGVKPLYVYKAANGSIEKSVDKHKNKFPVFFISEEILFEGHVFKDSVYLFLTPIQQHGLLRKNMGIEYCWVDKAPFNTN